MKYLVYNKSKSKVIGECRVVTDGYYVMFWDLNMLSTFIPKTDFNKKYKLGEKFK